jgi:hypothetical protein
MTDMKARAVIGDDEFAGFAAGVLSGYLSPCERSIGPFRVATPQCGVAPGSVDRHSARFSLKERLFH